jgi:xanthine dehydrogenase YagS FAD-binding subunit
LGQLARLIALDATVNLTGPTGDRTIPFASLHRLPGAMPNAETVLTPGDLITGFNVPAGPWTRRSVYLKIRDRQSYEFALASAAVAWTARKPVKLALLLEASRRFPGGPAKRRTLAGKILTEEVAEAAAKAAFASARPRTHNSFEVALGRATLVRALLQAAELEG